MPRKMLKQNAIHIISSGDVMVYNGGSETSGALVTASTGPAELIHAKTSGALVTASTGPT